MFNEQTRMTLFEAIRNNNLNSVEELIQNGVALDEKDVNGCSPMQVAVARGNLEIAKTLLRAGAEIDCLDEHIFGNAIYYRRLNIVSFLIEIGIDVNLRFQENEERTALMEAAQMGEINIVKKLVESGADVNAISRKSHFALMNAAFQGWQEVYDYLAPLTAPELQKWAEKMLPHGLNRRKNQAGAC